MINREKIPEQTYNELIDLLGYEKAEEFLNRKQYNFQAIQMKILSENLKRKFGKRFWIYFWILVIFIVVIYFLWVDLII